MKKAKLMLLCLVFVLSILIFLPVENLNSNDIKGATDTVGNDLTCICPYKEWDCLCRVLY